VSKVLEEGEGRGKERERGRECERKEKKGYATVYPHS